MKRRHRQTRGGDSAPQPQITPPQPQPEPSPMHARADDAADTRGKDAVQLGSEGSFPASDPPSWMDRAHPGGRQGRDDPVD